MTGAGEGWGAWRQALGRGVFPHQLAWFLELPLRRLVLSPARLASRLPLGPDASVLEIGPGSGYYSLEVARRIPAGHLELFDLQPGMLARCRAKCQSAGLANVGFTTGDGAYLPFADASFDLVYMVTVFGEVDDTEACLRGIRRVLKPAGVLSISEHMPDPDFTAFDTLRRQVEARGFRLEARHGSRWAYTARFRVA
jgi:ubiquinone/menaquinone biosynthesis C-methylase UbiE